MSIRSSVETFTQAASLEVLNKAETKLDEFRNRNVSQARVEQYAMAMIAKKWELNGEPIIFDEDGVLLDGQHRLWACVQAEVSFTTLVIRGVKRSTFTTIDTGKARTSGDVLSMAGLNNATVLASALGWLYRYEHSKMLWDAKRAGMTSADQFALLEKHPAIIESAKWASGTGRTNHVLRAIPTSALAFLHYRFWCSDKDKAEVFFRLVGDIEPDGDKSPTRVLRHALLRMMTSSGSKPPTIEVMGSVVKAWSAYIEGRRIKLLSWRRFGPAREDFPLFPGDKASRGASMAVVTRHSIDDGVAFLKDSIKDGPRSRRALLMAAKRKGMPVREIIRSKKSLSAIGIISRKVDGEFTLSLEA